MGTRSLTVLENEDGKEIAVLYRQYDGYLDGHGKKLVEFLQGFDITDGLVTDRTKTANGAGCLAAQVIAHFKKGAGGFYLYPAGTRDVGEDFVYFVRPIVNEGVILEAQSYDGTVLLKKAVRDIVDKDLEDQEF